jgi:hypothetical protein
VAAYFSDKANQQCENDITVDYVTFIWAELIVAASAVIIVWTWLLRWQSEL